MARKRGGTPRRPPLFPGGGGGKRFSLHPRGRWKAWPPEVTRGFVDSGGRCQCERQGKERGDRTPVGTALSPRRNRNQLRGGALFPPSPQPGGESGEWGGRCRLGGGEASPQRQAPPGSPLTAAGGERSPWPPPPPPRPPPCACCPPGFPILAPPGSREEWRVSLALRRRMGVVVWLLLLPGLAEPEGEAGPISLPGRAGRDLVGSLGRFSWLPQRCRKDPFPPSKGNWILFSVQLPFGKKKKEHLWDHMGRSFSSDSRY